MRGNCVRTMYGQKDEECGGVVEAVAPKAHTVLDSVYFEFNSSRLTKKGETTLNKLLARLRHEKIEAVTIAGYADAIGSDSYNLKLSQKRANAVKKYLNSHGFKHADTDVRALGKKDADASCKGVKGKKLHDCMQQDRRVDIELSVVK
jgi:OOP family OmpA-OmpF porin